MVLEVTTFRLLADVDTESFLAADKAVQTEVFPNTPGYFRRTTARADDGEWLVVILWGTETDIDEFNARIISDPVMLEFDELIDRQSITSKRYTDIGG
jgi:hypothetical protein